MGEGRGQTVSQEGTQRPQVFRIYRLRPVRTLSLKGWEERSPAQDQLSTLVKAFMQCSQLTLNIPKLLLRGNITVSLPYL